MLKRLRIIASVDPRHGGPIEGIRQHVPFHAQTGIEEHVVSLDPSDAPWVKEFPLKVFACGEPMGTLRAWEARMLWRRYGYRPAFLPWLRAHVKDYDVVVVDGLWRYTNLGARKVLAQSGVPYLVLPHGMLDPWFKQTYPIKGALKQVSWWFSEGPLLNNANNVLFTCEEEKIRARESFGPYRVKERVVAFGTSDPVMDLEAQTQAFRESIPELTKPYLLFLSRLHPKKGCDLLLEAFAEVFGARDDMDLVMAGPAVPGFGKGLKAQALALGLEKRVHWPGMLQGAAKWGAFRNAEAFVLPSHQENFGIVVAEAMACSRPVLISDKVNIWREVTAGGGGFADTDDVAGTVRSLRRFLALSSSEREEMGRRARQSFFDFFEVTRSVEAINDACREAIAAGRQRT
ncbi:glycosyltransferase [Xanthobacter sp. AM11]|uniref:glycosyltransferase n=1 Tax=Xanthobacter sp. AM11 TaxID=3380643 RepID=UPI0039BFE866